MKSMPTVPRAAWVVWGVWICRVFVMAGLRPP
jgi:hypothetical protein